MSLRKGPQEPNDFAPLLQSPPLGGVVHVTRVLASMGCFRKYDACPKCGSVCALRTKTSTKRLKHGENKEYFETHWKCTSRKCNLTLTLTDGTVWSKIKDRVLFVFVVNAFLNRATTDSVVNNTGCKRSTAEKYMMIIKNALHLDVENGVNELLLGGDDVRVQVDESCVFLANTTWAENCESPSMAGCLGLLKTSPTACCFSKWCSTRTVQLSKD